MSETAFAATVTCPSCGHQAIETMPTDRCIYFYECAGCHALLKPKNGDCCVFCSFADRRCPPREEKTAAGQTETR